MAKKIKDKSGYFNHSEDKMSRVFLISDERCKELRDYLAKLIKSNFENENKRVSHIYEEIILNPDLEAKEKFFLISITYKVHEHQKLTKSLSHFQSFLERLGGWDEED